MSFCSTSRFSTSTSSLSFFKLSSVLIVFTTVTSFVLVVGRGSVEPPARPTPQFLVSQFSGSQFFSFSVSRFLREDDGSLYLGIFGCLVSSSAIQARDLCFEIFFMDLCSHSALQEGGRSIFNIWTFLVCLAFTQCSSGENAELGCNKKNKVVQSFSAGIL